jgi:hypothetical protein
LTCYQGLLVAETPGGKLVDGIGQNRSIILGNSIGAVGLVAAGVDLDVIVSIAIGGVGVLVGSAGAGARAVIVVVIASNVDNGAACVSSRTSAAADEATEDARCGIKDVADDVAVAAARGVEEAVGGHLHLLHHLSITGLLGLLLKGD